MENRKIIMDKNCIIIHGCPSNAEKAMDPKKRTYDKHWIPWLKRELIKNNIKVEVPLMPNPWEPNYDSFKGEFEKYPVSDKTILVGHSCGCAFLVRWLGESKQKVHKLLLVGPWNLPGEDDKYKKSFYEYPIDQSIKSRVDEIVTFTSDDEEDDGKKSVKIFQEAIGGNIIELKSHGHYTMEDMGTEEFPELLYQILN